MDVVVVHEPVGAVVLDCAEVVVEPNVVDDSVGGSALVELGEVTAN